MTAEEQFSPILAEANRNECFRLIAMALKRIDYLESMEAMKISGFQPN